MDEPSAQLYLELRQSIQVSLATRRPLLHHLNADTSWFLQIPRPEAAIRHGARSYFNILVDPWLAGGQSDVAKWFSQQFHATESAVGSIAEVEELAQEIEALASSIQQNDYREITTPNNSDSLIDAVAISHEFTDHCHKDTLLQIHPDVPVFATEKAASLIRSWQHFRLVQETPVFDQKHDRDWRSTSLLPLPDWLGIARLLSTQDVLNYHSALLITFNSSAGAQKPKHYKPPQKRLKTNGKIPTPGKWAMRRSLESHDIDVDGDDDEDEAAEAIVYTPHGINNEDLSIIPTASPPIRTLAFLHGLHDIKIGSAQQLNLGAHNGLKAQRILNARYWIGTHDEVKTGGGLVAWFLKRKVISLKDALDEEKSKPKTGTKRKVNGERKAEEEEDAMLDSFADTHWLELANGESRVLV